MSCQQCCGILQEFDERAARRELLRFHRKGPSSTTRRLLGYLRGAGLQGASFLDVGGGVGALPQGMMASGASGGTHVDASPAFLAAARDLAAERGHADRIRHVEGDVVDLAPSLEPADVVTLDRVVCCYHDMHALVDASARLASRLYGLVFPREHLATRLAFRTLNAVQRVRGRPFRLFLHPGTAIDARVRRHGFRKLVHAKSPLWRIHVYIREPGPRAAS